MEITNTDLDIAMEIATKAHKGQVDKQGKSYILHVMAVVLKCETLEQQVVAALHDVVEDTDITLNHLVKWFPLHIVDAVNAITHRNYEDRDVYYQRVKANPIARMVKKADLEHNMERLEGLRGTEHYERLKRKYDHAWDVLFNS